jgi:hypothetical protein
MVAMLSRRVMLRPEIDEPCPDWARPLLSLSSEADTLELGIASERVPQETALALNDLFPAPPRPARERKRALAERRYKPYVKAWAAAVYFALLPYALAKQVSLFSGSGGETPADVAVLCFRRLADLAPRIGISYDRLQKWMTVLLVLGFVKRFRDGRNVLYILPLTAYIPSPSPEAVLKKLNELIESQYVEERLPDGRVVWLDRCPEWTAQLIEIRSRFILRYQLPPTVTLEQRLAPPASAEKLLPPPIGAETSSDQAFQAMLREISAELPEASRPELMRRLLPILARAYAEIIESTSGKGPLSDPRAGAAAQSGEARAAAGFPSNQDITISQHRRAAGAPASESRAGTSNLDLAGAAGDGKSRFDNARPGQVTSPNSPPSGTSPSPLKTVKVDSMAGESLTLRCNNFSNISFEEEKNVNVRDAGDRKAENRKKAELLADLLRVPQNVNFYTKLFNQASRGELGEDLIKAIFIYTLLQERAGDITNQEPDALGKYFYGVFKRWGVQRTYDAACQAYRKKWQSKTPPGIRPRDKELIDPFMPFGYEQIADMIRRGMRAEEVSWLPFPSGPSLEMPEQPMDEQEAEALAQAISEQASWYLRDPVWGPERMGDTVFFVVEAEQDGRRCTFTSWDQWRDYHEQMLTPPQYLEPVLRGGTASAHDAGEGQETGDQGAHESACARAACALFAYLNERPPGVMGDLDWASLVSYLSFQELAILGEPIRFPRERSQSDEPYRGPVAGEGLNVELEEGVVLTYEQFQVALSEGRYHGECVELEDGGFIPRRRYEELLAAGEYVELDDGMPVRADYYEALQERVRAILSREEAAQRRAESPTDSLQVERTGLRLDSPPPSWWKELCLDEGDGAALDAGAARQGLQLLQSALDPQLYWLQTREDRSGDALCFALELVSLCSGWILVFRKAAQVEKLLALLKAQAEEDGQQQEYALA